LGVQVSDSEEVMHSLQRIDDVVMIMVRILLVVPLRYFPSEVIQNIQRNVKHQSKFMLLKDLVDQVRKTMNP